MTLKKESISFKDSKQFSKLFIDYVNGTEQLKPFYSYSPKLESFKQIIADKSNEGLNREALVGVLKEQYVNITDTTLQLKNIELLLDKKTFTVCTGHQLCLFTGPMYFIYKILSTINLAEELKKKYPENDFVPIYWMASEDHDFAEIQSIHLFGKTVTWNNEHAKGAVGRLESYSMDTVIDELKLILGDSANANELIELFQQAYLKHHDLAGATRFMVHQLFKEYGLLVLDPDAKELKREFALFIKDDVLDNTNHAIVQQSIDELSKLGFNAQVNRAKSIVFTLKMVFVNVLKTMEMCLVY
ncbi:MAG: bacillithiol biosynthesis BshC [Bacteroidetes bacterium]|nr:bacillithiol biosynthesis BshC [Bacteroidota bacterium]